VDDALGKLGEARERYIELQERYLAAVDENRRLKEELTERDAVAFHDGAYWRKPGTGEAHSVLAAVPASLSGGR
jgi:hypothetical protein